MNAMSSRLTEFVQACRQQSHPIGLVTGVFDLLHQGHLDFLRKAKRRMAELQGCLVVGIESDSRVRRIKGEGRPAQTQEMRKKNLAAARVADLVFILPEKFDSTQDRLNLIEKIEPQLLLVSEHTPHLDKKEEIMSKMGGKVEVISQRDPRYSTSQLLQNG
jgi:cytidyltransferase-like protein